MRGPFQLRALGAGLSLFFLAAPSAACPAPSPTFPPILDRWNTDCDAFGKALAPARRHLESGGIVQDFENGQIAVHPRWAGYPGAPMPAFVLSARVEGNRIHVAWADTDPFEYDFFHVRWDVDDHDEHLKKQHEPQGGITILGVNVGGEDPQQIEEEGHGNSGRAAFDATHTGTYVISVEGCDDVGLLGLGSECNQGWSFPVEVDYLVVTLPPTLPLPVTPPALASPPFDLPDGPILLPAQRERIFEEACAHPEDMIDTDGDHKGELKTTVALAVLQAVVDPAIDCGGLTSAQLRALVNEKIQKSTVVSVPGTDISATVRTVATAAGAAAGFGLAAWMAGFLVVGNPNLLKALVTALGAGLGWLVGGTVDPGDYDMRLVGLIHIVYRFDNLLDPPTREHIVNDLLTVRGGESERREHVWIGPVPTFIPESENHILMTESSRYLTNELLALASKKALQPVPAKLDNDKNGMTDWLLRHLQSFVRNDFYEYNSRPYTHESMSALSNLYEFAGPPAACWQSNPPDPIQPSTPRPCDVRRGARIVMDYEAARFALASLGLRRASPYRRQPPYRTYPRLLGRQADSMTWRYLALGGGGEVFWKQRYGRLPPVSDALVAPLLGEYRVPQLIAHLMTDEDYTWFQRSYFERDGFRGVELSYRHPRFLISAGGLHDQGRLAFLDLGDTEDAWALPTTLMPRKEGLSYRDFVRIAGGEDEQQRANTCVAPGFACGLNPQIPDGIPETCGRQQGNWTFLDFKSPGCPDHGYYVAVYREACDSHDCEEAAGDGGTFGFFEATPYLHAFESFVTDVLAANQGLDFASDKINVYKGAGGLVYEFQPLTSDPLEWGIVSLAAATGKTVFERDMTKWPLAQGEVMRSDDHRGCILVDNLKLGQRLVLDFTDAHHPKRTRRFLAAAGQECGCPLPDFCLPPRYD